MKKRIYNILTLAFAVIVIAGCSSVKNNNVIIENKKEAKGDITKLTYFGYKSDIINVTAIENGIQDFLDKNPSTEIDYDSVNGNAYWEALEKRVNTGNLDDIYMIDSNHELFLDEADKLESLSDISTIKNYKDCISDQFMNEDGSVNFLPTCIITNGLYCNVNLLRENGFDPPENLTEFTAICDYFVQKNVTPIIVNNYDSLRTLIVAKGMYPVYQNKEYKLIIEKYNKGEIDIVETLSPGIQLVKTFIDKKWIDCNEALNTTNTQGDIELFKKGSRPFMITKTWASQKLKDNVEFKYGVYPYPILDDGSVLVMDMGACISINKDSENKAIAKKFIEYITQPDAMWKYCDSQSSFSPLSDDNRVPSDKAIEPQVPYFSNGRTVLGSNYNLEMPLDSALNTLSNELLKGLNTDNADDRLRQLLLK